MESPRAVPPKKGSGRVPFKGVYRGFIGVHRVSGLGIRV